MRPHTQTSTVGGPCLVLLRQQLQHQADACFVGQQRCHFCIFLPWWLHHLPLRAARLGLSALALSDHDTTLSAQYAYDHPVQDGVRLIPAAELTGYDFERSHRVHLLTFWPDLDCPALRRHCDIMRQRRNECALQSCREIEALYSQFRTEQALEYAQDSGVLFKSGIMQAL